jgi:hypothetical protein
MAKAKSPKSRLFKLGTIMPNPIAPVDGEEEVELDPVGKYLLIAIVSSPNPDKEDSIMKFFLWSKQLSDEKNDYELILDAEDVKMLVKFVKAQQRLTVWQKGNLIEILEGEGEEVKTG